MPICQLLVTTSINEKYRCKPQAQSVRFLQMKTNRSNEQSHKQMKCGQEEFEIAMEGLCLTLNTHFTFTY